MKNPQGTESDLELKHLLIKGLLRRYTSGEPATELYRHAVGCFDELLDILDSDGSATEASRHLSVNIVDLRKNVDGLIEALIFNDSNDPYMSLGAPPNSPDETLLQRRKRLLSLYHPDRAIDADPFELKAKRINEAFSEIKSQRGQGKKIKDPLGVLARAQRSRREPNQFIRKALKLLPAALTACVVIAAGLMLGVFIKKHFSTPASISVANKPAEAVKRGEISEKELMAARPSASSSTGLPRYSPFESPAPDGKSEQLKNPAGTFTAPAAEETPAPEFLQKDTVPPGQTKEALSEPPGEPHNQTSPQTGKNVPEAADNIYEPATTPRQEAQNPPSKPNPFTKKYIDRPEDKSRQPQAKEQPEQGDTPPSSIAQRPEAEPPSVLSASTEDLNRADRVFKLLGFADTYRKYYEQGNTERFLSLFASNAMENGVPIQSLRETYRRFFDGARLQYDLKDVEVNRWQENGVITGTYDLVKYDTYEHKTFRYNGRIKLTLREYAGELKIVSLDHE